MKKLIRSLMILTLLFGLTLNVHAEGPIVDGPEEIVLTKKLTAEGNFPGEKFDFTVSQGVMEIGNGPAPKIGNFDITIGNRTGELTGTKTIDISGFTKVGRYVYKINEVIPSVQTAGLTYDNTERELVIQVFNNGNGEFERTAFIRKLAGQTEKDDVIAHNIYKAGNLQINKVMDGNFTDPNDEFLVTVTLTVEDGKAFNAGSMLASGALDDIAVLNGVVVLTYKVKDLSEFTITDIPLDVSFKVEEDLGNYNPFYTNDIVYDEGDIVVGTTKVLITNYRDIGAELGINLDNLPYYLTLGVAIVGIAYLTVRKRRTH